VSLARSDVPPLYAITDPSRGSHRQLVAALSAAGAKWVQVREKTTADAELLFELEEILRAAPPELVLFVNDRADLALAAGAHGVHVGDEDLPPRMARDAAAGRPLLIGYSTHSLEEVREAEANPAVDYIAVGPIFTSPTKNVREALGLEFVRRARDLTSRPLVAIGGINRSNIGDVLRAGADSTAVISALYGGGRIDENVRGLLMEASRAR
jgi:thiamine-phosphate pyrophosphorylase